MELKNFFISLSTLLVVSLMAKPSFGRTCAEIFESNAVASSRVLEAQKALVETGLLRQGDELSPTQKERLHRAHWYGYGQPGKDGTLARVGNYTTMQNTVKLNILRGQNAFTLSQAHALAEAGVVGYNQGGATEGFMTTEGFMPTNIYGRPKTMHDYIAEHAPKSEVRAAYERDAAMYKRDIRTGAGGSPDWHLARTEEAWQEYDRLPVVEQPLRPAPDTFQQSPGPDMVLNPHGYWIPRPRN